MVSTLPSPALSAKARGLSARIEGALAAALSFGPGEGCPPRLASALRYAVFPAGGRVRPQLCLLTAIAVGDADPVAADGAAAAVELIHCASLVHDDLPCFDDADRRRGKPSAHKVYGEALAVLAGDGLILLAFDVLTRHAAESRCIRDLVSTLAESAGAARGVVAGQAWESEPSVVVDDYHRAKTASLFEAACAMGALAGGGDPRAWRPFGEAIGLAYQAADDLRDATGASDLQGKPAGRDAALDRPSFVRARGPDAARGQVGTQLGEALARLPQHPGARYLAAWVERLAVRLESA